MFTRALTVRKKQLEQVQVCLGCKGLNYTHEDRYVNLALNTVLGNSMSSRLFQEVREQNALAYSIYSYVTAYRDTGLLTVYAGTDPANALQAVRLIMKELKKIRDEGITPAEELRVKNQTKGQPRPVAREQQQPHEQAREAGDQFREVPLRGRHHQKRREGDRRAGAAARAAVFYE